jgi:hypothetical protein
VVSWPGCFQACGEAAYHGTERVAKEDCLPRGWEEKGRGGQGLTKPVRAQFQ